MIGVLSVFFTGLCSRVRHGSDVFVFAVVPVPRPTTFFMTIPIPFVSLLALSCIQPRSMVHSAPLALVNILINSLTLEVHSIAVSTTPRLPRIARPICAKKFDEETSIKNNVGEPITRISVSIAVVPHNYAYLFDA